HSRNPVPNLATNLTATALALTVTHCWPLVLVLLMRLLLWPQLLRPAGLGILALGLSGYARLLGALVAGAVTGRMARVAFVLLVGLDPSNVAATLFSLFLCRRAWRIARDYEALVRQVEIEVRLPRRVGARLALAGSVLYAVGLAGFALRDGAQYSSTFA